MIAEVAEFWPEVADDLSKVFDISYAYVYLFKKYIRFKNFKQHLLGVEGTEGRAENQSLRFSITFFFLFELLLNSRWSERTLNSNNLIYSFYNPLCFRYTIFSRLRTYFYIQFKQ